MVAKMEYRESMTIKEGWETAWEVVDGKCPEDAGGEWKTVSIPHNWEQYHGYHRVSHGNLHGAVWYKKTFEYQEDWNGKRVFLFFEGVSAYADVWLNETHIGSHKGGRTCFQTELTAYLNARKDNTILVRASHPEKIRDIPWICGGCFGTPNSEGSQPLGIFRPVHIQVTGSVRVKPFGVCITTPNLCGGHSDIRIESELVNLGTEPCKLSVRQELLAPDGELLRTDEHLLLLKPGEEGNVIQTMEKQEGVSLWYPDAPVLYRVRTTVWRGQERLDCVENSFGFREITWENFDSQKNRVIDEKLLEEEPGPENHNFVEYLRGSEDADVAIAAGGVAVYIRESAPERVVIAIETTIRNRTGAKHRIQLESFVQTYNRTKSIASLITQTELDAGEEICISQTCEPLAFPDFWSRENPTLHNVISTVRGVDEELKEYCQTGTPFAIRGDDGRDGNRIANKGNAFVEQAADAQGIKRRLLINGRHYFLNGSCEYEHELGNDHAFEAEMIRTRMQMFRAAGFNAFREAHCPHNLRYLEYCEQNGILYWAQMGAHIYFDSEDFRENFLRLTKEWILERRNSPAIILWSVQNESMLPSDFTETVTKRIHEMDVTSPVQRKVVTCNGGTGSDWNIPQNWSGTYGGSVENYGTELVKMQLVGEYGQYRVKGKHEEGNMELCQNSGGDVPEELFTYCLETKVREAEKVREYCYGHFQWIFTSHANPGRELLYCLDGTGSNRIGVVNSKGLFTCWGEPTDAYYMYRANYTPSDEAAVLYIASHSWPQRFCQETTADIAVYSNCEEVELYNDYGERLIERKRTGATGEHPVFHQVSVKWGILTAKGYVNGKHVVTDRIFFPALPLPEKDAPAFEEDAFGRNLTVSSLPDDLYRINCGGPDYRDRNGHIWAKDRKYEEGSWGWQSWGMDFADVEDEIGSFAEIYDMPENTEEAGLFQKFRYGRDRLSYTFPVENGEYVVELYFMEPWYGTAGENAKGWRLFDVSVNGETRLEKLDIWQEAGGAGKALKKRMTVTADKGKIQIAFPEIYSNQAVIQAIRIAKE